MTFISKSFDIFKIKKETQWFESIKACGAAGADTIVVIHSKGDTKRTLNYFEQIQLEVVFSGVEFSSGMDIEFDKKTVVGKEL